MWEAERLTALLRLPVPAEGAPDIGGIGGIEGYEQHEQNSETLLYGETAHSPTKSKGDEKHPTDAQNSEKPYSNDDISQTSSKTGTASAL